MLNAIQLFLYAYVMMFELPNIANDRVRIGAYIVMGVLTYLLIKDEENDRRN